MPAAFERLMLLPVQMTETASIGSQITRLRLFESVRDIFSGPLAAALLDLPFIFLFVIMVFVVGGHLGWIVLAFVVALALIVAAATPAARRKAALAGHARGETRKFLMEFTNTIDTIRNCGAEETWLHRYGELTAANLKHQLREARHELHKLNTARLEKLTEENAKIAGDLEQIGGSLRKHQDKVQRLIVQAPTSGVINLMPHKSIGEVIKPGDLVAEIVSLQTGILVEAQLQPKDLGHVKLGDKADIKISNFDPSSVGVAHGEVVDISPTTFQSKDGSHYYRIRIKLHEHELRNGANVWTLLPGMTVEADIVTGSKSLMQYMLKPLYRSLTSASIER